LAGLPVLVSHGQADTDLAFDAGRALHDWLHEAGCRTRWLPFEGGHEIPLPVWREFRRFLRALPVA
jgi:phospholipase/carboxylesterase